MSSLRQAAAFCRAATGISSLRSPMCRGLATHRLLPKAFDVSARRHSSQQSQASQGSKGALDFSNTTIAFESKSTFELFRAWAVFQTCAIGWVVRNCDSLYALSLKVLGSRLTHGIMRYTLFNHFC